MNETTRIWLLKIESLDELNQPSTLRFASGSYIDSSNNYWDDRIKQPALYTNSAYVGSFIKSSSKAGYGEAILINTDRGLDYLANHAVDGRECTLYLRDENNSVQEVFKGTVQSFTFSNTSVQVKLRDTQEVLSLQHPYSSYSGNNILPDGLEGISTDIKGKVKPRVFGKVSNQQPTLVNTVKLIYESHDSSISPSVGIEVTAVRDRGVLLAKHAHSTTLADFLSTSIPSGKYVTYLGYFRLGAPATGTVTCDAETSLTSAGSVFDLVCTEGGFQMNPSDKSDFNLDGDLGFLVESSVSTSSLLDKIALSFGAYWYFEDSQIRLKKVSIPSTTDIFIDDSDIINIERTATGCGSNGIPVTKVNLKYDKVETTQNDLAASVPDATKARLANAFRETKAEDTSVKVRHLLAEEMNLESCLVDEAAATSSASSILDVVKQRRDFVTCSVRVTPEVASQIKLGRVVNTVSYKLGYNLGKNFIILGFTLDARVSRVQLELFG
jgi:hypothetical protein